MTTIKFGREGITTLDSLREGTTLGHYQLLDRVGRGGQADVWSARDSQTGLIVAIKLIVNVGSTITSGLQFSREAHLVAQLRHSNIVPLYDYGEMSSLRFLVMRYMVGGSLSARLRKGLLSFEEIARIIMSVAATLDFIHDNSIVHRDLKPGNVLLDSVQAPYLSDFGLARELTSGSTMALHTPEGTVPYMSPEQVAGEHLLAQSDLYSLGIMLFEMLTGELPLQGRTALAFQQRQTGASIPDPVQVNPTLPGGSALAGILRRLTAFDPAERPGRAVPVIQELLGVLGVPAPGPATRILEFSEDSLVDRAADALHDARNMLTEMLGLWTPLAPEYPFTRTEYMLIVSALTASEPSPELPQSAFQTLLLGALYFYPAEEPEVMYWWEKTPPELRRQVCWAVLLQGDLAASSATIERVLSLAKLLQPDATLPPQVLDRLIALVSAQESGTSSEALSLIVGWFKTPPDRWRTNRAAFDDLIAELASGDSPLAEDALAAIIATRSACALHHIAALPNRGQALALLAEIWLKTRSLPPNIHWSLKARVLLWIGFEQLTHQPDVLIADYAALAAGFGLATGLFVFITFRAPDLMRMDRIFNALASGLFFGLQFGVAALAAQSISRRLLILPAAARVGTAALIGGLLAALAFASFHALFYRLPPASNLLVPGGVIFIAGFALNGAIGRMHLLPRIGLIAAFILAAVMLAWILSAETGDDPLLYFEAGEPATATWLLAILYAIIVGVVGQAHQLLSSIRRPSSEFRGKIS